MNKAGSIFILGLLAGVAAAAGPAVQTAPASPLLRDGFILTDAAGTLIRQAAEPSDGNDVWLFEFSSDVDDSGPGGGTPVRDALRKGSQPVEAITAKPVLSPVEGMAVPQRSGQALGWSVLKAGTRLELLPSSTLERIIAGVPKISNLKSQISDSAQLAGPAYLLSGRVTKYKGRNFIFPNYFLVLSEPNQPKAQAAPEPGQQKESPGDARPEAQGSALERGRDMALDEPNDVLAMPPDFIEKLRARRLDARSSGLSEESRAAGLDTRPESRIQNLPQGTAGAGVSKSTDAIFVDRTGFLIRKDGGRFVFAPDALGRNIQNVSLRLLPCEVLELAEREQSAEPETIRFKMAGIVTEYKGDSYLLLQKAIRTYSHGNFGR